MTTESPARPFGRDEVRDAILDAAARHFANYGTSASLRHIAADAGVNLGLIHRHFGNKDDLLRAVLAAQTQGGIRVVEQAPDVPSAVREMFLQTTKQNRYVRTVAWMLLAGMPADDLQRHYPAIRALRDRAAGTIDELDLLACFALMYGWTVFGEQLLAAFDRTPRQRRAVEAHLSLMVERLASGAP
jgi:AcrR family transcriptional regulator